MNSEGGRKLNQAFSQAKEVFSSFLSTFSVQPVTATTDPTTIRADSPDKRADLSSTDRHIKIAEDGGANTTIKRGIVEIGRDANAFESNNKSDIHNI